MKLFTKIISIMLVLAMLLSFAACTDDSSKKDDDDDEEKTKESSKAESSNTSDADSSAVSDDESSATSEPEVSTPATSEPEVSEPETPVISNPLVGSWKGELDFGRALFEGVLAEHGMSYEELGEFKFETIITFNEDNSCSMVLADEAKFETDANAFAMRVIAVSYTMDFESGEYNGTLEEYTAILVGEGTPAQALGIEADDISNSYDYRYENGKLYRADENGILDESIYSNVEVIGNELRFISVVGKSPVCLISGVFMPTTFIKQ